MINGLVAHVELEIEIVKWTSSIENGVALRQMAQGSVK